ncbi:non-specific lipid transfer protein GPI-anchored 12-like [Panicum virgatum]|uniref:Bifunctional inhibitor/plant lipid transfer protein/seed storage helical domain-containing protein n=1 Tax=Panicum virgatum TaxID=38727 RepID=A0A8T0VPS5_PANVG|nr:non-specific lipid transfer protein GPI-anchored 12-like [Panicum virgatum]KAG2638831.1 hypothetical protein PVAP13_2NG639602 [Panicum virgatum]
MATPPAISFLAVAVALMAVLQPAATNPPPPPAPPATGAPTTCMWILANLGSCLPFLSTGTSLAGPPASCCGSLRAISTSPASICLCHLIGGEVNQLTHTNIDPVRLAILPLVCLALIPPELPYMCFVGPVPPISGGA